MSLFEKFVQLHQNARPFLLGNIWDVQSAKVFESSGYQAIGVSSQAMSNALGYEDGENLPFEVLLQIARRVAQQIRIPFTVDMEGGYSRSIGGINENIEKLHDAGVVGVNLEDTIAGPARGFQSADAFQKILLAVADHISRRNLSIFLNVRTDGFLLGLPNALGETLSRISKYENTGANGIFVPCITQISDIKEVVNGTKLPVNVMCMPQLPDFEELGSLGVKRVSMGPFLFNKVYREAGRLAKVILDDRNFSSILS